MVCQKRKIQKINNLSEMFVCLFVKLYVKLNCTLYHVRLVKFQEEDEKKVNRVVLFICQ